MAKTVPMEFIEGAYKYTPVASTPNEAGVRGRIWARRVLHKGSWVWPCNAFVRWSADEAAVVAAWEAA